MTEVTTRKTRMPMVSPVLLRPHTLSATTPAVAVAGERVRRVVQGELDIDRAAQLQPDLFHDLLHSIAGLDLDLMAVTFCDCSGLNLLLRLHRQAVRQGKTLVISAMSPAVARILDLTRTRAVLVPEAIGAYLADTAPPTRAAVVASRAGQD
ncbi:STAS domain-containing protein [Streptomyces sp. A1499]|uniref:STAS domain-containing protein n=1 Tax=Streptomyces sp. A1499 TaxID=2563104 RepID=UPI00109EE072|nr:STAS domain-containing protein [Streptomyces sp. A1499]THC40434.1 anti-sigma factor antagonist [Streptomyces sp. A1499]